MTHETEGDDIVIFRVLDYRENQTVSGLLS